MEAIHTYFKTYYVPNNRALILSGALNFEETIKKVNAAFGSYESKAMNHPIFPEEAPLTNSFKKEVYKATAASIIFQDIRGSSSLAHSAFASYDNASKKGSPNYVMNLGGYTDQYARTGC
jgi:Zn-dependent M16 (insulinase) family peptidase